MKKYAFSIILLSSLITQLSVYSQDKSDTTEFKVQKKFIDRKMAWYINVTGLVMNTGRYDFLGFGGGTTFEMKLWNNHSLTATLNLFNVEHKPWFSGHYSNHLSLNLDLNYRYYHNLKDRMSKGLTGNNFNANYILIAPYFLFDYEPYRTESIEWDFKKGEWVIRSKRKINLQPYLRIGYGIQRSVWKNLNLDVNCGFQINQSPDFRDPLSLFYLQFNLRYILK